MDKKIVAHYKDLEKQKELNNELENLKQRIQSSSEKYDIAEISKIPPWIKEIIESNLLMETESAKDAGALGFYARTLAMCVTPYKNPNSYFHKRKNGNFEMMMMSSQGVPYGVIPRLLMSWVTTEVVRTKEPVLKVGASLAEFLRSVFDLEKGGGVRGNSTRVRQQMIKLFSSHISVTHVDPKETFALRTVSFADEMDLNFSELEAYMDARNKVNEDFPNIENYFKNKDSSLWTPIKSTKEMWESELVLNDKFFKECITTPVPIDLRAYKALKGSPLAMDIYTWLTYRMSYLRRESKIPWEQLMMQFGANFGSTEKDPTSGKRAFRRQFELALKGVMLVYPAVNVEANENFFIIRPSPTHIPFSKKQESLW
jgi:hypothetical protein